MSDTCHSSECELLCYRTSAAQKTGTWAPTQWGLGWALRSWIRGLERESKQRPETWISCQLKQAKYDKFFLKWCHRLNACASALNSLVETLTSHVSSQEVDLWEVIRLQGGIVTDGIHILIKAIPESSLVPFRPQKDIIRSWQSTTQKKTYIRTQTCWYLDCRFPVSRTAKNNFLLFTRWPSVVFCYR